ncbi:MAG: type II methionyl aminopeptidase [Candidatus Aenigmarchaeota archaeon]
MEPEVLEKYRKAGKIGAEIREDARKMMKPGLSILELANFVEDSIRKKGGNPAFPVNISLNEAAAHYTPSWKDERVIKEGDLVKVDIGVHIDGYIGDLAFTYCSEKSPLIEASQKALDAAIKIIRPGVTIGELGTVIQETVDGLGLGVVTNLTGHTLSRFVFHGSPNIPNVKNDSSYKFHEDSVIALEPFIAESNTRIKDSGTTEIYRHAMDRPVRLTEARKILQLARDDWKAFPFAKRWLFKHISPIKVALALRQLESVGALEAYPVLRNITDKPIAQSEDTIIVQEKPIVTTRL